MKILENPGIRAVDEPGGTGIASRTRRKWILYREKEELLFAMDEKSQEADLTEKGRNFISPKDPDAFVLPDLTTRCRTMDAGPEADARKRMEAKTKVQAGIRGQGAKNPRHLAIAPGVLALSAGRGIRHPGKQGHHRGPAHGAADAGPPLERRVAPGGGGEGRSGDRARDADAGDNHHPELFPAVQEAGGHDRHGGDGGDGISRHLQARRADDPDEQAEHPQGRARFDLQNPAREIQRGREGNQGAARAGPAHPGRARFRWRPAKCSRGCSSGRG